MFCFWLSRVISLFFPSFNLNQTKHTIRTTVFMNIHCFQFLLLVMQLRNWFVLNPTIRISLVLLNVRSKIDFHTHRMCVSTIYVSICWHENRNWLTDWLLCMRCTVYTTVNKCSWWSIYNAYVSLGVTVKLKAMQTTIKNEIRTWKDIQQSTTVEAYFIRLTSIFCFIIKYVFSIEFMSVQCVCMLWRVFFSLCSKIQTQN